MLYDLFKHLLDGLFGAKFKGQVEEYGSFRVPFLHLVPHGKTFTHFKVLAGGLCQHFLDHVCTEIRIQEFQNRYSEEMPWVTLFLRCQKEDLRVQIGPLLKIPVVMQPFRFRYQDIGRPVAGSGKQHLPPHLAGSIRDERHLILVFEIDVYPEGSHVHLRSKVFLVLIDKRQQVFPGGFLIQI